MTDIPDPIVRITDIVRAGYCPSGARRWFTANGLDFRDFMKNGIPASVLTATGCAMADRVVELVMADG